MVSIDQIIEEAQALDPSGERIQRGEYLALLIAVSKKVAMKTQLWVNRFSTEPNSLSSPSLTDVYSVVIPYADPLTPTSINSPYRILQVTRQWGASYYDTQEYSVQSVASSLNTKPFVLNDYRFGEEAFSIDFLSATNQIDDSRRLNFSKKFEVGELVHIDYIQANPYGNLATWEKQRTVPMIVPDFLFETLKYGLIAACLERLGLQGDDAALQKVPIFETKFKEELKGAAAHSRMFKDNNSNMVSQPYKFVSDGEYF